jgi:hypothetical protein
MSTEIAELVSRLDLADSREDGLRLLQSYPPGLSDELAESLWARANELKTAGESVLGDDFSAWASEARSIVTLRLATSAIDTAPRVEFLRTHVDRFDDGFYEVCFGITSDGLLRVPQLLDAEEPESAVVDDALGNADQWVQFSTVIAVITDNPQYRAKATFLSGTLLLFRSQWEARQGCAAEASKTSAEAFEKLQSASSNSVLPAELRAYAEMRLAALAGPSNLAALAQHQQTALEIAEAGKAWNIVTTVRRDQAYWARQRGDWHAVWDLYRQNIELSEREMWEARVSGQAAAVEDQTQADYEGAVEACMELAKSDPSFYERALESAEHGKARAFLRGLATVATALPDAPPKLQERRNRIFAKMSDPAKPSEEEAERLLRALRTVEDQIWKHPRAIALDMQCVPCTYEKMCALVPRGGVILTYFILPDRLLIFVLGEHGLAGPPAEVKVSRSYLIRWAVELRLVIQLRGDYQSIDDMQKKLEMPVPAFNSAMYLRQLGRVLLEPVASHLAGKRLIVVVPHRVLSGLPIHACTDANGRALIEDAAVVYAAGLSVLRWCQDHERTDLNTCFAAGVRRLAGGPKCAELEAAKVAQAFGVTPCPATRTSVLQKAGDCDVVHLACHSDMESAFTAFAGLALEDGSLSQREIAGMRCRSNLVTLSACQTGGADTLSRPGAELAGLVGAFFRAGCPSVIASQWPADDAVSGALAETFYAALKRGASKAEALQTAQLAIKARTAEGYDDPYFWAPFGLWGNN